MLTSLYKFVRPAIFALEPETAHEATLRALEAGLYPRALKAEDPVLAVQTIGLEFPNPVGIAAGYDKDARVPDAILGMGFGFAEIGTVTPKPQQGNPQPRVFRLVSDEALINRLGFNNSGHRAALTRLQKRAGKSGVVGVNLGANKDSRERIDDYILGLNTFNDFASYFAVNISSPNTPGLRDLQAPESLHELLSKLMAARANLVAQGKPYRPIILKVAPDIAIEDVEPICNVLQQHKVDGIAVSNTTFSRDGLTSELRNETGGLSGAPLFDRATTMLAKIYVTTGGKIPLIGIGGINAGERALAKIEAGASLIQLYTALVYKGPSLVADIKKKLIKHVNATGSSSISELTGSKAEYWATHKF